jgi:hypothetical protein
LAEAAARFSPGNIEILRITLCIGYSLHSTS